MIARIDEMTAPPVVGQSYLVPTLRYRYFGRSDEWPVIGPKHADAEFFDFPYSHYHIDGRFITRNQQNFIRRTHRGWPETIQSSPLHKLEVEFPDLVWRRRKCSYYDIHYRFGLLGSVQKLRAAFADKRLIEGECGLVCPHRGAHLGSIVPDHQGVITCPLHGLRWRVDTGTAA